MVTPSESAFATRRPYLLLFLTFSVLAGALLGGCHRARPNEPAASGKTAHERARAWFQKGLEAKDPAEAERCYQQAIRERPGYPEAHNNLGDVYEKQGKYEAALKEYQVAAALAPALAPAWFGIGDVHFTLGNYEAAMEAYKKGLAFRPKDRLSLRRMEVAGTLATTVQFGSESGRLTDTAKADLRAIAAALADPDVKNVTFEVQGHTDSRGSSAYNHQLSIRRAERVRDFLVDECGISPDRLACKGCGEDMPLASNDTGEGRAMNRRVQVVRGEKMT